nr:Unknown Function [uncultured bacterium]
MKEFAMIQPTYGETSSWADTVRGLFPVVSIIMTMLYIPHLAAFFVPPEVYNDIQMADIIGTFTIFMAMQILTVLSFNLYTPSPRDVSGPDPLPFIGLLTMALSIPLNILLLGYLGEMSHIPPGNLPDLHLGNVAMADGSAAWGLQARMSF